MNILSIEEMRTVSDRFAKENGRLKRELCHDYAG